MIALGLRAYTRPSRLGHLLLVSFRLACIHSILGFPRTYVRRHRTHHVRRPRPLACIYSLVCIHFHCPPLFIYRLPPAIASSLPPVIASLTAGRVRLGRRVQVCYAPHIHTQTPSLWSSYCARGFPTVSLWSLHDHCSWFLCK
ncbi:uncharacterized protein SCHCODRAFT_01255026 [Schizophyllum commune H4-8]|uniref:uncharacterized protein n=1 Tax=Schizophyllum commune (strain H4-8 / FGSC 9210) TaxID=578458 RepID=UPI00215E33CD|nr:uncharacterized protein SCHCODRAFT_01255026 [Schizophyllum commune H4-8]KAI5886318.1 hypothetical protein SCHCODRAFT_01255026 [Schizophyllum commune H4-8]